MKFTADPDGRATMGTSSGGSAALIMAWYHPEWFRRVLTLSGSFAAGHLLSFSVNGVAVQYTVLFDVDNPDGALMPQIVLAQFVAKVAGGAFWAWLLTRVTKAGLPSAKG